MEVGGGTFLFVYSFKSLSEDLLCVLLSSICTLSDDLLALCYVSEAISGHRHISFFFVVVVFFLCF